MVILSHGSNSNGWVDGCLDGLLALGWVSRGGWLGDGECDDWKVPAKSCDLQNDGYESFRRFEDLIYNILLMSDS